MCMRPKSKALTRINPTKRVDFTAEYPTFLLFINGPMLFLERAVLFIRRKRKVWKGGIDVDVMLEIAEATVASSNLPHLPF